MSYPILYKANESNFNHLGVSVLSDALSCLVTRERNGIYILEMEYPVDGKDAQKIKEGMIIKTDAGYRAKNQKFIVSQIIDNMNGTKKVYCKHISQVKTMMNAIKPNVSVAGSAQAALRVWRENLLDSSSEFTVWSDVPGDNLTVWDIEEIENAREALGGKKGSILDVWGGEYEFDNLNIKLHNQMGRDVATIIAYGRNLTDLEQELSILETYTSIYPFKKTTESVEVEKDGNKTTEQQDKLIFLPEFFINSEHANKFTHKRILKVDFSSEEEIETVEQLRKHAEKYIKDNNVGVPKVNLTIKYQDLSKVEGVWANSVLEEVDLCDRVKVYYEDLGITNESAKVIKVVWNVLLDENYEIEIGDSKSSFVESSGVASQADLSELKKEVTGLLHDAEYDKKIKEAHEAFIRYFNEESQKIKTEVKDGIEKERLRALREEDRISREINSKISEATKDIPKIRSNYQKDIDKTKRDLESLVVGRIDSIQIPDVSSIVNTKIREERSTTENLINEKIANIEPISVGARNYILNSDRSIVLSGGETRSLTLSDDFLNNLDSLRGQTLIASVHIQNVNASGQATQYPANSALEMRIEYEDGEKQWLTAFNGDSNFSGRVFGKLKVKDKPIAKIGKIELYNRFSNGRSDLTRPMIEIANTQSDWRPAEEDSKGYLDNKFSEYKRNIDGEISRFSGVVDGATKVANEAKTTATSVQSILSSITPRFNANGSLKEFKNFENSYNRTANETREKLANLDSRFNSNGTVKNISNITAEINRTADSIREDLRKVNQKFNADGSLKEFKNFENSYNRTANETSRKLEELTSYRNADMTRRDEIIRATSSETARQINAERETIRRDYIAKSRYEEDVRGLTRRFNEQIDSLNFGARNYAEDYNFSRNLWEYTQGDVSRQDYNFNDGVYTLTSITNNWKQLQIHSKTGSRANNNNSSTALAQLEKGKQYTLSFQAKRISGSSEVWVSLRENRKSAENIGRIFKTFTITDDWKTYEVTTDSLEISPEFDFWRIILGYSQVGKVAFKKVELTQSRRRTDAGQALEDSQFFADRKVAEYRQTVDGTLSRLEQSDRDSNRKISTIEQNINNITSSLSTTSADLNRYKTERNQTDRQISDKVTSLENNALKIGDIQINSDNIRLGASKTIDKATIASMVVTTPEAVKAITDSFVVTANHENLLRKDSDRNFTINNTRDKYASNWYQNTGDFKLKAGDEFLIKGEITNSNSSHRSNIGIHADTTSGGKWWYVPFAQAGETGERTVTLKLPEEVNDLNITKYRIGANISAYSDHGSRTFANMYVIKKKDASLIVDGSVTARHIKSESIETGHFKTGALSAHIAKINAIESENVKLRNALIDNLMIDNAIVNRLKANSIFAAYLNSITIDASQINGGVISANVKYRIGTKGQIAPFSTGVRFTVPENESSNRGVGFQVSGKQNGNINKGINVYKLDDFSSPDKPRQDYGDTLMTVHGQILAGFQFENDINGKVDNFLGKVVCTNLHENRPIRLVGFNGAKLKPIHALSWGEGGGLGGQKIVFTYGGRNNVNTFMVNVAQSYSDEKLKTDIEDSDVNAVDFISKLKFKKFKWRGDIGEVAGMADVEVGLIAQDIEKIEDNLVSDVNKYKELEYNRLSMYSMKAVQELIEENKILKERLEKIEKMLEDKYNEI
ncbi:tail fiber domain-containing protein [Gemella sp. 19428wG2_WT2a]|nr:tail fiber domain-containing protein [Gemella sp. 19428wG2_WT2a]TFU57825.1 hypothetical protein E4T67_06165 [Gemella sp. WT2a]